MREYCDRHGFEFAGLVPWSDGVAAADRARKAVIDVPGTGPVTAAVASICGTLGIAVAV